MKKKGKILFNEENPKFGIRAPFSEYQKIKYKFGSLSDLLLWYMCEEIATDLNLSRPNHFIDLNILGTPDILPFEFYILTLHSNFYSIDQAISIYKEKVYDKLLLGEYDQKSVREKYKQFIELQKESVQSFRKFYKIDNI